MKQEQNKRLLGVSGLMLDYGQALFTPRLLSYIAQPGLLLVPVGMLLEAKGPKKPISLVLSSTGRGKKFKCLLWFFYRGIYKYQAVETWPGK